VSIFGSIIGAISGNRAAKSVSDANIAAEHGVLNATSAGQTGIQTSLTGTHDDLHGALDNANIANNGQQATNANNINTALTNGTAGINSALTDANGAINTAGTNINTAATTANSNLQDLNSRTQSNFAPGIASGTQGNKGLQDYVASNPQFKFSYDDYKNDPAYQFQLSQGANAITNQAASQGLSQGGSTLAALTQFGQGVAATHYNDAFGRAKQQFDTNQNKTLANFHELIGAGNAANAGSSQANQVFGGLQSSNTTGAAGENANLQKFLGDLNTSGQKGIAELNSQGQQHIADSAQQNQQYLGGLNAGSILSLGAQGLQGNEESARLGLSGATTAGDFAVGAGTAHGAGILNQGKQLTSGISDLTGLLGNLVPGLHIPGGGG
jgi:hypothetical protein